MATYSRIDIQLEKSVSIYPALVAIAEELGCKKPPINPINSTAIPDYIISVYLLERVNAPSTGYHVATMTTLISDGSLESRSAASFYSITPVGAPDIKDTSKDNIERRLNELPAVK